MSETFETTFKSANDLSDMKGAFVESLKRNAKQIKSDRAIAIAEDAETEMKRRIEDLIRDIRKLERERESRLDMSPDNVTSLKLATEFDASQFVNAELEYGEELFIMTRRLQILQERYNYLFK